MDRPIAVDNAVRLLIISIVLNLLLSIFYTIYPPPLPAGILPSVDLSGMIRVITPVVGVFTALFNGLIAYKILQGRNWARWLFISAFAVGLVFTIPALRGRWNSDWLGFGSDLVQAITQAGAAICLLTSDTRLWFAERKYDR